MDDPKDLLKIHEQYIDGTKPKEHVKIFEVYICTLPSSIRRAIKAVHSKVYLTSKVIKHMYDRHCHEKHQDHIYAFLLRNIHLIMKDPDIVRDNKESKKKTGAIVFIKEFDGEQYICPVELGKVRKGKKLVGRISIVSGFKAKKGGKYLAETKIHYQKQEEGRN